MRPVFALIGVLTIATLPMAAQGPDVRDVRDWMAKVGARVEAYFVRAQSLICEETVRIQPLGVDLLPNGDHVRELVYELHVAWEATPSGGDRTSPAATVLRELLTVDGRPPRRGEEPGCFDREPVSPEPLAMFLPQRQQDYVFAWKDQGRARGRASVTLEYRSVRAQPPTVVWRGDCVSIDLPGHMRGRVWLDSSTADVLRLDEELMGQVEVPLATRRPRRANTPASITIERADSSTSYLPVTFHDPEETVLLPASIVSLQITRNSGTPRLRTYQTFSKYRRFLTDARIIQ